MTISRVWRAAVVLLLLLFVAGILALHRIELHADFNMPLLYTLPVLVTAWVFRPWAAAVFTVLALAAIGIHAWTLIKS